MKRLILLTMAAIAAHGAPIRTNPAFDEVLIFEGSGGVLQNSFATSSSALANELVGNLNASNRDFAGLATEHYDIFYSNSDGTFNLDGEFITIQAMYSGSSSGLNVNDVQLRLGSNFVQRATSVSAFVPGATNFIAGNLNNAIDTDTNTGTAMGVNAPNTRMSITLGFDQPNSSVPEPSTWAAGAAGLGLAMFRLRASRCRRTA